MSNVLSFPTGMPFEEPEDDPVSVLDELKFDEGEEESSIPAERKAEMLSKLDALRALVEEGRCDSLILIAQDPMTGYFLTETSIDEETSRHEMFGFMGVLDILKNELSEHAMMAPVITLTGQIQDPYSPEQCQ